MGTLANVRVLQLNKDKSFNYSTMDQMMMDCQYTGGLGAYSIENDTVYLNFRGMPDDVTYKFQQSNILKFEESPNNKTDHSMIKIQVVIDDYTDTIPWPGYGLTIQSTKGQTAQESYNENASTEIELLKSEFPISVQTNFIGYEAPILVFTDSDKDYDVVVMMSIFCESSGAYWIKGVQAYPIEIEGGKMKIQGMMKTKNRR